MPVALIRVHYYQAIARNSRGEAASLARYIRALGSTRRAIALPTGGVYLLNIVRARAISYGYIGQIQMDDIPTACNLDGIERELRLRDDEGLLEKSFFTFHDHRDLLVWQRRQRTRTPATLSAVLELLLGKPVEFYPVLRPKALERLMVGDALVKHLKVTVARPTNADMLRLSDPFSSQVLDLLRSSEGFGLQLTISANAPGMTGRSLSSKVKRGLAQLAEYASTARAIVVHEDGTEEPIDLINDRLDHEERVEYTRPNPTEQQMYAALEAAWNAKAPDLERYFSSGSTAIA